MKIDQNQYKIGEKIELGEDEGYTHQVIIKEAKTPDKKLINIDQKMNEFPINLYVLERMIYN